MRRIALAQGSAKAISSGHGHFPSQHPIFNSHRLVTSAAADLAKQLRERTLQLQLHSGLRIDNSSTRRVKLRELRVLIIGLLGLGGSSLTYLEADKWLGWVFGVLFRADQDTVGS